MKTIAVLGSTGSIGTQTLEVVEELGNIRVAAISGNQNIDLLESRRIDGFIVQPPETINTGEEELHILQKKLNTCSTPYVILDRAIHDIFHDYVAADHQLGGYLATDHLVRLGHTRIGCITGSLSDYGSRKRLAGYREVLSMHGIPYDPDLVYEGLYQMESGKTLDEEEYSDGIPKEEFETVIQRYFDIRTEDLF